MIPPIMYPAKISIGQCIPTTMREIPINNAPMIYAIPIFLWYANSATASAEKNVACPDGNESIEPCSKSRLTFSGGRAMNGRGII